MLIVLEGDIDLRDKFVVLELYGKVIAFAHYLVERPLLVTKIGCYQESILMYSLSAEQDYHSLVCIRVVSLLGEDKEVIPLSILIKVTARELLL